MSEALVKTRKISKMRISSYLAIMKNHFHVNIAFTANGNLII
ncbi:hypothetical protein BN424_3387 [Carnobacterium maltaromaticum LMA28]|uniref:Uncharacterized protein n=1 Tax=Carnobacterium maltaromaticum LMA28 TaxID=1234679 RepID=K8ELL4_CARML|nr:hypothetical protein BN424_3387 [Carnobacterium maltaromaticum LMA28]